MAPFIISFFFIYTYKMRATCEPVILSQYKGNIHLQNNKIKTIKQKICRTKQPSHRRFLSQYKGNNIHIKKKENV